MQSAGGASTISPLVWLGRQVDSAPSGLRLKLRCDRKVSRWHISLPRTSFADVYIGGPSILGNTRSNEVTKLPGSVRDLHQEGMRGAVPGWCVCRVLCGRCVGVALIISAGCRVVDYWGQGNKVRTATFLLVASTQLRECSRQAVADVEELKKKLEQMQTRSNALETALRTLQATVSDIPHPLLEENAGPPGASFASSPSMDTPISSGASPTQETSMAVDEEDVLDAFGMSLWAFQWSS